MLVDGALIIIEPHLLLQNVIKSQKYKINRYQNIEKDIKDGTTSIGKVFLQITSLRSVSKSIKESTNLFKGTTIN